MNSVPRSTESHPGGKRTWSIQASRGSLWVSSGHLESAAGAGGQPESGVLRGAAWVGEDDANTAGKPQASSGSPLGPPCDFETGAPNHSLETVTPLASSRGRWRLRHRAS